MFSPRLYRTATHVVNKDLNRILICLFQSSTSIGESTAQSAKVKPFSEVPGPKGLYDIPFLGAALFFKPFSKYTPGEINEVVDNLKHTYGDIFKMRFGKEYIVYVNSPEYAKTVFLATYTEHLRPKFDLTAKMNERTNTTKGMILLDGKEWAERRKPAQEKMMRPAVVASYVPLIEKVTNDFVERLRKKEVVDDVLWELVNYTTESVGMLCFNKRLGCITSEKDNPAEVALFIREIFDILQKSFFHAFKSYLYFRTPYYKRFETLCMNFYSVVKEDIASQKSFLAKLEKEGKLEEYLEKEPNFMYSLIADGRLNDDQINSVVVDLFGAGIDSTANSLVFLLAELAANPDKQTKLLEEINRVVGDCPNLTKQHLAQMSYLKACVKESQRKTFPVSFGAVRILESDLVVGEYKIPKHTLVAINNRSMSSDERFYYKPKEYLPERWLRETTGELAKGKEHPFLHKPFGFGPRSCIGQRFAENEIFIAVTKIIQNFEVSLPPDAKEIKSTLKIFTTPTDKVKLRFKERK